MKSGEKLTIHKKNLVLLALVVISLSFMGYLFKEIFFTDSSVLIKTSEVPKPMEIPSQEMRTNDTGYEFKNSNNTTPTNRGKVKPKEVLKLKAHQIIDLNAETSPIESNSFGSTIRVKLLNDIDTREPEQICKVMVVGNSISEIPAKTLLFGKASLGASKRVLIRFDRAFLPDGDEAEFSAQAVDSKTNKNGIEGNYHGRNGLRAVGSMGLNMVSGISETLTQKESLGGFQGQVANKPTLKNAIFNGIAKTSEQEALRHAENLNNQPEYAELKSGSEFSVQILEKIVVN
ncbi:MAG: TrbI/VirB10 family protein [Bdellovibrionales bacterium]|nr:TrbI/VirB10 family protein [Bdellovibrionales bacterium]